MICPIIIFIILIPSLNVSGNSNFNDLNVSGTTTLNNITTLISSLNVSGFTGKYKYNFKKYVFYSDVATTSRQIDYRLVVNSECVNYVLACFRPNNYGTIANPVTWQ
jgi:hypothetical protein